MSFLIKNGNYIRSITFDLSRLKISSPQLQIQQIRGRTNLNRPRLRNPSWFVKKERAGFQDYISPDNASFIKEIVHEKFGPPAIIKGVQSFQSNLLIKSDELVNSPWDPVFRRTGVLGKKIGQYPLWLKDGRKIHTTLLQVIDNHVIKYIPPEEFRPNIKPKVTKLSKFGCLIVGSESIDPTYLTKDYCGLFKDSGVMPKKNIGRFIVSPEAKLLPGTPLNVTHFKVGDYVDIRGKTIDHGFQGVCKRHGFKGMPASHGVTKTHRRPGNIGGGGEKGRVWPGTKLPGHMGNRWRMHRGLKIWRINTQYNVMWVSGHAIPGPTNGLVYIFDTMLPSKRMNLKPPFPTSFEQDSEELPADLYDDNVHRFDDPTIFFEPEKV